MIFRTRLQHIHQTIRRRHLIRRAILDGRAVLTLSALQGQGGRQVPLPHLGAEGATMMTTWAEEADQIIKRSQIVTGVVEAPTDLISLKRQDEV